MRKTDDFLLSIRNGWVINACTAAQVDVCQPLDEIARKLNELTNENKETFLHELTGKKWECEQVSFDYEMHDVPCVRVQTWGE